MRTFIYFDGERIALGRTQQIEIEIERTTYVLRVVQDPDTKEVRFLVHPDSLAETECVWSCLPEEEAHHAVG